MKINDRESMKTVITMSHEGIVAFWQGLLLIDWYNIYRPVYTCLVVDNLKEFICGTGNGLLIFTIDKHRSTGKFLNVHEKRHLKGHADVVRCLVSFESRIFSGGFDGQIIVYDTCGKLDPTTRILLKIPRAHDGIISCLVKAHNVYDHQKLVISGSFDRHVKIWNDEGQLMHVIENFSNVIISIAHIPTTDTFWVTSGSCHARIFDVQTGEDVTEYVNTFMNWEKRPYQLRLITFCPDLNMIVGSTSRQYLIVWKYNSESSALTLKTESGIQCLCASYKPPFSIFSSGSNNHLSRWERKGQTHFSYVRQEEMIHESIDKKLSEWLQEKLRTQAVQTKEIEKLKASLPKTLLLPNNNNMYSAKRSITPYTYLQSKLPIGIKSRQNTVAMINCQNSTAYNTKEIVLNKKRSKNFLRMIYIDELDFVVAACEDGVVYVLGYDLQATKKFLTDALCNDGNEPRSNFKTPNEMKSQSNVTKDFREIILNSPKLLKIFNKLRGTDQEVENTDANNCTSEDLSPEMNMQSNPLITMAEDKQTLESVSRHLFGMKCRYVLVEHKDSVTCLLYIDYKMHPIHQWILLTSGWDRCICIWNLKSGKLIDKFLETQSLDQNPSQKASKGAILDMAYNSELDIFAYACSDCLIYVRKFSLNGNEMHLQTKLIGHNGPVNCIVFNPSNVENGNQGEWITGSDDCTIRIWKTVNEGEICRLTLNANGPITCLRLDFKRNILLAGVDKEIKIYDLLTGHVYRNYKGHRDIIRSIIILPEEDEYVSASADGQIRIWSAWKGNRNQPTIVSTDQESAFAAAQLAAVKLSLNPAASLGAAARAFSKAGRFRCIVECLMRHQRVE
ncbi:unnamed protein product [Schistosoma bovis]|nr:unnamed protein product [Schistosoma bovis]